MEYTKEQQQNLDAIDNNQSYIEEIVAMSKLDEKELLSKLGEADFKNRIKEILQSTLPAISQRDKLKELLIEFNFYSE